MARFTPSDFANNLGGNLSSNYVKYDGSALGAWGSAPFNRCSTTCVAITGPTNSSLGKTSAVYAMPTDGRQLER